MPTPSGVFPSPSASLPSPRSQHAGALFTGRASPLAVGSRPPPLYSSARCCHLTALQRVVRVPRPQGLAPTASPLRPSPERRSARYSPGLFTCMVEEVVRFVSRAPRSVRHGPSEPGLPSSCAPDLSVSCGSHPPAQGRCVCTVPRPPQQMRSAASPPATAPTAPRSRWFACWAWKAPRSSPYPWREQGGLGSDLVALSSGALPREAHADVQRSGFVLLSFSAAVRRSLPREGATCERCPGTPPAVCWECLPATPRLRVAAGVRRPLRPRAWWLPRRPWRSLPPPGGSSLHDRLADTDGFVTSKNA